MLIPVIISGGSGSRLWPLSRKLHPKPFIKLDDGQSLLQKSFLRGAVLDSVQNSMIVSNKETFFQTKEDIKDICKSQKQNIKVDYLLEPVARGTAAAICVAAIRASQIDKNAILLVLPADHLIEKQEEFSKAVGKAVELAKEGKIVTFGIEPTRPETGYGYIEHSGNEVIRFCEKPDKKTAQDFIDQGNFVWNSGMFCFLATSFIEQMKEFSPEIIEQSLKCMKLSTQDENKLSLDLDSFSLVPNNSIDYALMEKSKDIAVVACDIGWSDIGSWNEMADLVSKNKDSNQIVGEEILTCDTQNCYLQSSGKRVLGAVGLKDLIVVDTQDAILVAHKENAQDVKKIYTALESKEHDSHLLHTTVARPWGTYCVLEEGIGYKIKRIVVNSGSSLSLQKHKHRSEHWVVVAGVATVRNGEEIMEIKTNQSTYIPAGTLHRLENKTNEELAIIEVQSGSYLGEDDIERFDDIYGR